MRGQLAIVEACEAARTAGRPGVLATVVRVEGSAYRRPGARMFLAEGLPPVGLVSGGCLEEDLALRAAEVRASGRPSTVVYDMRSPDDIVWGLGLGCAGEVRVLLEVCPEPATGRGGPAVLPEYMRFIGDCERARSTGVVGTVFESSGTIDLRLGERVLLSDPAGVAPAPPAGDARGRVIADARRVLQSGRSVVRRYQAGPGTAEVLLEYLAPSPRLLLFGAGQDAGPVVRLAQELGWRVSIFDHRPAYAGPGRFPGVDEVWQVDYRLLEARDLPIDRFTAVVVMTHHFLNDRTLLPKLLSTPAPYIGLLGPRKRAQTLLAAAAEGAAGHVRERVFGPVGLDIGSETPEEIALSLLSEIQAVFAGRRGGFLRERDRPLHDGGA